MVSSVYESLLSKHSAIYAREVSLLPNYFYEALAFNVSITGNYTFWSNSEINTYGYLYCDDFNPFQPLVNRLTEDDSRCGKGQFHIAHHLLRNMKYVLVVTTHGVNAAGRFWIISAGPTTVRIVRHGHCNHIHKDTFTVLRM
jgi:hypothetical protein